jgi:glycosyltransferase involved in cell wall biosynthesis
LLAAVKILLVLPEFGDDVPGGIARFYKYAVDGMVRAGCQVDVCIAVSNVEAREIKGVRIFGIDDAKVESIKARLQHFQLTPDLRHQLAVSEAAYEASAGGAGYDVVETTDWGFLYASWLTREPRRAPVVVQFHGSPGQIGYLDPLDGYEVSGILGRMIEVALLPRADELQTSAEANAKEWTDLLARPVTQLLPAWPTPSPMPRIAKQSNSGIVAARIQTWKGPHVLCDAVRLLGAKSPRILWVGGDHPTGNLQTSLTDQLCAQFPDVWGKVIAPVGVKSPQEARQLQLEAKFAIHPSTWDVFGLAVVEAMAAGKVVICSSQSGVSSLILNGQNGFIFDSANPRALADRIEQVDNASAQELVRIGAAASLTITEALDIDRITQLRLSRFSKLSIGPRPDPHPWLLNLFGPRSPGPEMRFLDCLPLRKILKYVAARIAGRVFPRSLKRVRAARAALVLKSGKA